MEEDKNNLIRFEMSGSNKFIYYKMGILVVCLAAGFLIFSITVEAITKSKLIEMLKISLIIIAFFSILILPGFWKIKRARCASELAIDKEKKEFRAFIYDIKKEVTFRANNIIEVGNSPEMFRFFLKDGTWISWAKDDTSKLTLEEIIKSFGISIVGKKLW